MTTTSRGTPLTVLAILFGILAVSNLLKPFEWGPDHGFVLLGQRMKGSANQIAGPVFGLYLLGYAAGIWGLRRWALPMGIGYAIYVTSNLVLFPFRTEAPMNQPSYLAFIAVYAVVAVGCSWGAVHLLRQRASALR